MFSPLRSLVSIASASLALLVLAHFSYGQSDVIIEASSHSQHAWQQVVSGVTPQIASSYLVFDVETGEVLLEQAADTTRPIASLTKLVSAAVVWEEYSSLPASLTITPTDVVLPGAVGAVQTGEVYSPHELLFPLLLTSSNHAAAALERTDTELVTKMNQLPEELGLSGTTFADASGLSDYNVATARDIQQVLTHLHQHAPHVLDISRLDTYVGSTRGWTNNNPLVTDTQYRGGKHGYTPAAGRTSAALFSEDFSAGPRLLGYVVLGATDSAAAVTALRTHVTETMDWQ